MRSTLFLAAWDTPLAAEIGPDLKQIRSPTLTAEPAPSGASAYNRASQASTIATVRIVIFGTYEFWFPQGLQLRPVSDDVLEIGREYVSGSGRRAPHGWAARYPRLIYEGRVLLSDAFRGTGAESDGFAARVAAAGTACCSPDAGFNANGAIPYGFQPRNLWRHRTGCVHRSNELADQST